MNKQILEEDVQKFAEQFELAEQLRGKTFLVTGATGLIGSVLIRCLLALNRNNNYGIKVIAIVRSLEKALQVFLDDYSLIDFRQLDLGEITLSNIKGSVDFIVHLASPTASLYFVNHPVETLRTAIEGTTSVLEYAKNAEVQAMVYASSIETYGANHTEEWIKEDFQGYVNPTEVRSSYNMGKRVCECLCHSYAKEYGVNVSIARLTQTFGAGISDKDNRVFAQFARSVIEGKDIELHTPGLSSKPYCYTTDVVSAILYLLLKGLKGEAYNVANSNSYISIFDMAQLIGKEYSPNNNVVISRKNDLGYAPETNLRMDSKKLEELGWKPIYNLREMFERLIRYIKSD